MQQSLSYSACIVTLCDVNEFKDIAQLSDGPAQPLRVLELLTPAAWNAAATSCASAAA